MPGGQGILRELPLLMSSTASAPPMISSLCMLFDVTNWAMTNRESPAADGAVGLVSILSDAFQPLVVFFPFSFVFLICPL